MTERSNQSPAPAPTLADMDQLLTELSAQTGIDRDELGEMVRAVKRGEPFYEYLGASEGVVAAIENAGVTFYASRRYEEAEGIFRLLAMLTAGEQGGAFRGLAACRQVALDYEQAIANYLHALQLDASDLISAVYLSECLLITGQNEPATRLLASVLEDAERYGQGKEPHVKRAKALLEARERPVAAEGGQQASPPPAAAKASPAALPPPAAALANTAVSLKTRAASFGPSSQRAPIGASSERTTGAGTATKADANSGAAAGRRPAAASQQAAQAPAGAAKQPAVTSEASQRQPADDPAWDTGLPVDFAPYEPEFDHDLPPAPRSEDPEVVAFLQRPNVRERLDQLSEMYRSQAITLRDIADFPQEQIDAGYAVCYKLLEQKNYAKCLEMCGWMLHIDSHDPRFYQLAGLSAMGVGLYCLAEFLFASDTIWREGGPDAATLIYKGEALLQQEEYAEGLRLVAEGMKLAAGKTAYGEIVKRGQLLEQHYRSAVSEAKHAPH